MTHDTLILGALAGLAIVCLTVLAVAGAPIPEAFGYAVTVLLGALTGATLPAGARGRGTRARREM